MRRINYFGGPGIGKSTNATEHYLTLKKVGENVELVQEYIKQWAYEKKQPKGYDQLYVFVKQLKKEEHLLRNGVQTIVTDSPLLLQCFYTRKAGLPYFQEILNIALGFDIMYKCENILLSRVKPYVERGRYQTEDESREIDKEIKAFLDEYRIPYRTN